MEAVTHGQPACLSAGKEKQTASATCSNTPSVRRAWMLLCPAAAASGLVAPVKAWLVSLCLPVPICHVCRGREWRLGFLHPIAGWVCRCFKGLEGVLELEACLPSLDAFSRCGDAPTADTISPYTANILKLPRRSGFPLGLREPQTAKLPWEPHQTAILHPFSFPRAQ